MLYQIYFKGEYVKNWTKAGWAPSCANEAVRNVDNWFLHWAGNLKGHEFKYVEV